jgi:DNA-directed RNA polymerase subunit RPC12/RpoP
MADPFVTDDPLARYVFHCVTCGADLQTRRCPDGSEEIYCPRCHVTVGQTIPATGANPASVAAPGPQNAS